MMPVQLMVIPVWVERLGWTLVHSLWLLTFIAILAAIVLRFLRSRSARARYAAAVAMLALMVIGPMATWGLISGESVAVVSSIRDADDRVLLSTVGSGVRRPVTSESSAERSEDTFPVPVEAVPPRVVAEGTGAPGSGPVASTLADVGVSLDEKSASNVSYFNESLEKISQAIKPRLPVLVGVWFLGVLICSIRPVWGLWIQWRLRHTGLLPVSESIQSMLNVLMKKLGLTRAVRVAESALVKVPLVVGYLRPMILLPASVITGLSLSQLEAVLAHELAHVRRHDWLVNALQVIVETLLFYHPAFWWLSSRIRQERELCCDDIALGLNVDKAVYARMLLTLEELQHKAVSPALAATGGDLAARVRRLLPPAASPNQARSSAAGFAIIVASLALVLVASSMTSVVRSEPQSVDAEHPVSSNSPAAGAVGNTKIETGAAFVTGQVIHTNGKPAAGVEVNFGTNRRSLSEGALLTGVTDANGRYRFKIPERHLASRARVYVIPMDAAAVSRAVSKNFGEQPVFQLQRGTRLSGKVVDAQGKSVATVVVKVNGGERIPMRYAITNDQGEYTTPPCQYGDYKIQLVNSGAIPSSDERGVTLSSAYLRKEHVISKSARSQKRLEDFHPVDSVKIQVHLQSSNGNPVSDDSLYLFGTMSGDSWSERLHEVRDRTGLYEIMVPKGLYGRFGRMHPHGWPKNDYVLSVANGNLGHFVRDESLVFTMKKICWLELTIAVDGNLINQRTHVHDISNGNSVTPFDTHESGIFYSLKAAGDPLEKRFANANVIGPFSRGHASLHMTLAPETEYELRVETLSGKSWKETFITKEGESRKIEANLVSDAQAATSATEANESSELSEAVTEEKKSVVPNEQDNLAKKDLRKRTVKVVDENEKPVAGAEVRLQFMHDEDGGYYVGELITKSANEKGIVEIAVPEDAGSVSIAVVADGFNALREQQAAAGSSSIRLKRGRSIHVRAVDEAGKVLTKAVPLLAGHRVVGREFVPQEDGTFKSPSVDLNRHLMRVVTAQEDGPLLFSELVDVAEEPPGANGVLELVLKAGTKLTGRLDDSVPRPISEGYAELMIVEGPNHQLTVPLRDAYGEIKDADRVIPWTWEDSVAVQPDGTFAFESVPSGGIAQLHVVVDGYMSANPSLETLLASIEIPGATPEESAKALKDQIGHLDMWPILVPLDGPNIDVAIKCQPTASCDFRILDPSGNPLPNAAVFFSPNGVFISGKLFLLGSYDLMSSTLVDTLFHNAPMSSDLSPGRINLPEDKVRQKMKAWADRSFSGSKSDADGRVNRRSIWIAISR